MNASQAARNFCQTCSDFAFFTGPLAFHSACSALSSAKPASKSVTVDSASARAMSASLVSRLVVHTCLRCFRSSCRRVKNRLQAVRKRSHTDCSSRRGAGPMVFHSACSALSVSAVAIQSVESASASACSHKRDLACEVLDLLRVLRRAERLHALAHRLRGRAEARPQLLGLVARGRGHAPSTAPAARASGETRRWRRLRSPSAAIFSISCSCTPALAQRCQSSASRNAAALGCSCSRSAASWRRSSCRSGSDGS